MSYGSYSSLYTTTAPMEIANSSYLSRHPVQATKSCAFPSWPRRDSLSESDRDDYSPNSFLTDEELFPTCEMEDDALSVSSSCSASLSVSPQRYSYYQHQAQLAAQQAAEEEAALREQQRYARLACLEEKERRRQQSSRPRVRRASSSGSSSSKKSPKPHRTVAMTPIAE